METIALKCLQKDITKRYPSAQELADDLERFLSDRPILARRSTRAERAIRWCRRNRLIAALGAAVTVLIVASIAILSVSNAQIRQKSRALETALGDKDAALIKAREAVDQMLVRIGDEKLSTVPLADPLRRALLEDALGFYQGFVAQSPTDLFTKFQFARVLQRTAILQRDLNHIDEATGSMEKSIAVLESLANAQPDNYEYQEELAKDFHALGYMWSVKDNTDQAEKSYIQSVKISQAAQDKWPNRLQNFSATLLHLAQCVDARGDHQLATKYFRDALARGKMYLDRDPKNEQILLTLCWVCGELALQAPLDEREKLQREAHRYANKVVEYRADSIEGRFALACEDFHLADCLTEAHPPEESINLYKHSMSGFESLCVTRPAHNRFWRWTRKVTGAALHLFDKAGHRDDGIKWMQSYQDWLIGAEKIIPDDQTARNEFYACLEFAGKELQSRGQGSKTTDIMNRVTKKGAIEPVAPLQ